MPYRKIKPTGGGPISLSELDRGMASVSSLDKLSVAPPLELSRHGNATHLRLNGRLGGAAVARVRFTTTTRKVDGGGNSYYPAQLLTCDTTGWNPTTSAASVLVQQFQTGGSQGVLSVLPVYDLWCEPTTPVAIPGDRTWPAYAKVADTETRYVRVLTTGGGVYGGIQYYSVKCVEWVPVTGLWTDVLPPDDDSGQFAIMLFQKANAALTTDGTAVYQAQVIGADPLGGAYLYPLMVTNEFPCP